MGRIPDRKPAHDPKDIIYEDPAMRAVVYALVVTLANGIKGDMVIRVLKDEHGTATCDCAGPAWRYLKNSRRP